MINLKFTRFATEGARAAGGRVKRSGLRASPCEETRRRPGSETCSDASGRAAGIGRRACGCDRSGSCIRGRSLSATVVTPTRGGRRRVWPPAADSESESAAASHRCVRFGTMIKSRCVDVAGKEICSFLSNAVPPIPPHERAYDFLKHSAATAAADQRYKTFGQFRKEKRNYNESESESTYFVMTKLVVFWYLLSI